MFEKGISVYFPVKKSGQSSKFVDEVTGLNACVLSQPASLVNFDQISLIFSKTLSFDFATPSHNFIEKGERSYCDF